MDKKVSALQMVARAKEYGLTSLIDYGTTTIQEGEGTPDILIIAQYGKFECEVIPLTHFGRDFLS